MHAATEALRTEDAYGTSDLQSLVDAASEAIEGMPDTVSSQVELYDPTKPEEDKEGGDLPSMAAQVALDRVLGAAPGANLTHTQRVASQQLREAALALQNALSPDALAKHVYTPQALAPQPQ